MQRPDIVITKQNNPCSDALVADELSSELADHEIGSIAADNSRGSASRGGTYDEYVDK